MRRSYLFILLLCAFVFTAADGALAAYYDEHTGDSWEDAYIIDSAEDLQDMREYGWDTRGKYYKLSADILIEYADQSLYSKNDYIINSFNGHFDGQGYTVNISFDTLDYYSNLALFNGVSGQDSSDVVIKNLNVTGTGKHNAGIVRQLYSGTIENCSFNGTIEVFDYDAVFNQSLIEVGGIVGEVRPDSVVRNCHFSGDIKASVSGPDRGSAYAGGIAGKLHDGAIIDNCTVSSTSSVHSLGGAYSLIISAGGIVGHGYGGTIQNCNSGASITADFAGGILGYDTNYSYSSTPVKLINNTYPSQYPEVGNDPNATVTPTPTPVTIDPTLDSDGDGLPDAWELYGLDLDGDGSVDVDLPAMGADPNVPDIFVEVDYMVKPGTSKTLNGATATDGGINLKPSDEAMKIVMEQFARSRPAFPNGINLHIDTGSDSIMDLKTGKKWGSLSRSNTIDYADNFDLGNLLDDRKNWNQIVNNNFESDRTIVFKYCIVVNKFNSKKASGLANNIPGQFFIIADVDNHVLKDDRKTAGTFMHELGHTLGLQHGGDDIYKYKPNYLSIMNYLYQFSGLIASPEYMTNYSEYVLPSIDKSAVNEERGIDPDSVTGGKITEAKWKLADMKVQNLFVIGKHDVDASDDIAGAWIDFNQNGKKDTNAAIDFYVEGLLPNVITINLIPESINDWEHLTLKAGYIGGVSSKTNKSASIADVNASAASEISFDISNAVQEITLEEAEELGLLHNPGDCEVSSVMPDVLYTGVNNQKIKVKVSNMFDLETTAHLQVTSDLLASVYSSDINFAASADKIIELTVPSSALTAGKHALTYTLTCANEEVKTDTSEIEVQSVKPIVLKVGESETLTGTAVGAYALSVEDATIATIEGSTVYAIEAGKTFIILKDLESDRTVCSLPIYVTETGELDPEDVADDTGTTDPTDPSDTTDPDGTTDQTTSSNGSSGGCNSGLALAALSVIALAAFKKQVK